jgi:hypothetical protein
MKIYNENGLALLTYKEARDQIGRFECEGDIVDDDTTIVFDKFDDDILETGPKTQDHYLITLWFCTADVFCKCGETHHITCDTPPMHQMLDIVKHIKQHEDSDFYFLPSYKEPKGSLIVYILQKEKIKKTVEDLNDW